MSRPLFCINLAAATLVLLSLVTACTPDSDPTAPSSSAMYGHVTLVDEYGDTASVQSGTSIIVRSSGGKSYSGTTDAAGNWRIENIPAEVYEIAANNPDYDSNSAGSHRYWNRPHPGAGALQIQEMSLTKVAALDIESTIGVRVYWHKDSTWDPHGHYRYDSTLKFFVDLQSKESRRLPNVIYRTNITAAASADCATRLFSFNPNATRAGDKITLELTSVVNDLIINRKNTVDGKTFYLQLRRLYYRSNPSTGFSEQVCLEPYIIPFTF